MICTAGTNRSLAVAAFCNGLSKNNDEHLEAMNFNSFPSRRLYFSNNRIIPAILREKQGTYTQRSRKEHQGGAAFDGFYAEKDTIIWSASKPGS
jgi:hypothetical protein